jgi:hypothetical protein
MQDKSQQKVERIQGLREAHDGCPEVGSRRQALQKAFWF